jgi:hypothetical protein
MKVQPQLQTMKQETKNNKLWHTIKKTKTNSR